MDALERRETDRVGDYLREEGLLDGAAVYAWPGAVAGHDGELYADIAGDDEVKAVYTLVPDAAVPEPNRLQEGIQLFAGRRSAYDAVADRVVSLPDAYGVSDPDGIADIQTRGTVPAIDVELAWPGTLLEDRVVANLPLDEGSILRLTRGRVRDWTRRANRTTADAGALLVRVDDFDERGVTRWMTPTRRPMKPSPIDAAETVGFYLGASFGFAETYRLDEDATGHTYVVGERPRPGVGESPA